MIAPTGEIKGRRRRRRRQLLLLQTSGFGAHSDEVHAAESPAGAPDSTGEAVLRASSLLDEPALRASWRLGRDRLVAMAEFERHVDAVPVPVPRSNQVSAPAPTTRSDHSTPTTSEGLS